MYSLLVQNIKSAKKLYCELKIYLYCDLENL